MPRLEIPKPPDLVVPAFSQKIYPIEALEGVTARWRSIADIRSKKRGPRRGSIARFAKDDRAAFDDITQSVRHGLLSNRGDTKA